VVTSTYCRRRLSLPVASSVLPSELCASVNGAPAAKAALMPGRSSCGAVKTRAIGSICAIVTNGGLLRRVDHVALVDEAEADPAADRRGDRGVIELHLRGCERCGRRRPLGR